MNVIVIVADTFRNDNFNEDSPAEIPELTKFMSHSVVFDNCYTTSFPTVPHRTDCFTGKYSFPWHGWQPLDTEVPVLSTILGKKGFVSQLITDCPHLMGNNFYFQRGFHAAKWIRGQEIDWEMTRANYPLNNILPDEKTRSNKIKGLGINTASASQWHNMEWNWEEDRFFARTAKAASKWLELNYKRDNLFLWLDFFDPHEPWDSPGYMINKYDPDYKGISMFHPNYGAASDYTAAELKNLQAHYYAEVYFVDKWIGHVLKKIEEVGLMEDTMIIFTSDHGIYLGERNRTGKSNLSNNDDRNWPLYEEVSHVPLFIYHPEMKKKNRHNKQLVQPVDIFETILDYTGVRDRENTHGKSLLPLICEDSKDNIREYAFSSSCINVGDESLDGGPTVTGENWSYIPCGSDWKPELYYIGDNPSQKENVIEDNMEIARKMHLVLLGWLKEIDAPERSINYIDSLYENYFS